jgi:membrane protease YdiL (CAAX protease family)
MTSRIEEPASPVAQPAGAGSPTLLDRVVELPPLAVALGYLAAIIAAELLTTLTEPRIGLALHSTILILLVLHAALTWDRPIHGVLVTLTFAPLIRLVSLSLPLFSFPLVDWYLIISLPLFVAGVLMARLLGLSRDALGINLRRPAVQLLIGLTGLAFGYIEYRILHPQALAASFTWRDLWAPALVLLISTGFFEEFAFRGLMQTTARPVLGRFGLTFVALVFAALHIGYKSVPDLVFVFLVGLFFGWAVVETGSILGVSLSHGLTNIMLFLVIPFMALGPPAGQSPQPATGSPAAGAVAASTAPVTPTVHPPATAAAAGAAGATASPQPSPRAGVASPIPAASPTSAAATPAPTRSPIPAVAPATPTRSPTPAVAPATPTRSPTPAASPALTASPPWAVVKENSLNVRAGPGAQYDVLALAKPDQRYPILRRDAAGEWLLIRFADGLEGWVSAGYVTVEGELTAVPVGGAEGPRAGDSR